MRNDRFEPEHAEPTFDEIVQAVLEDAAFQEACGPREGTVMIARAALSAAFVHIGLYAIVEEILHERAGHA